MDVTAWTISALGILTAMTLVLMESRKYPRRHRKPHH
jgi:predicted outer membrane lipoprotein